MLFIILYFLFLIHFNYYSTIKFFNTTIFIFHFFFYLSPSFFLFLNNAKLIILVYIFESFSDTFIE